MKHIFDTCLTRRGLATAGRPAWSTTSVVFFPRCSQRPSTAPCLQSQRPASNSRPGTRFSVCLCVFLVDNLGQETVSGTLQPDMQT